MELEQLQAREKRQSSQNDDGGDQRAISPLAGSLRSNTKSPVQLPGTGRHEVPYVSGPSHGSEARLREALAEMEAKLLKVNAELFREKEEHTASKARLAVEMQNKMHAAEQSRVESHTAMQQRLKKVEAALAQTQAQLQAEKRTGMIQEAEL
jgi:hypothetical protein